MKNSVPGAFGPIPTIRVRLRRRGTLQGTAVRLKGHLQRGPMGVEQRVGDYDFIIPPRAASHAVSASARSRLSKLPHIAKTCEGRYALRDFDV